jgi:hypothetical protein
MFSELSRKLNDLSRLREDKEAVLDILNDDEDLLIKLIDNGNILNESDWRDIGEDYVEDMMDYVKNKLRQPKTTTFNQIVIDNADEYAIDEETRNSRISNYMDRYDEFNDIGSNPDNIIDNMDTSYEGIINRGGFYDE